jgi:triacylglycerol lipase
MRPKTIVLIILEVVIVGVIIAIEFVYNKPSEKYGSNVFSHEEKRHGLSLALIAYANSLAIPLISSDDQVAKDTLNDVQDELDNQQVVGGLWEVVWGPALYRLGNTFYDNMMFVVQHRYMPWEYRIVIRGTNPVSLRNWIEEDFKVLKKVPWQRVLTHHKPTKSMSTALGSVSEGTFIALTGQNANFQDVGVKPGGGILMMKPCHGPHSDKTILQYLKWLSDTTYWYANVDIVGHSLGGLLSSTLHLYLEDLRSTWDPRSYVSIRSMSFAAPTAGDSVFANHANQVLNPSGNNTAARIHNERDVATYAWDNIDGLTSIYRYGWWSNLMSWLTPSGAIAKAIQQVVYNTVKNLDYKQPGHNEPFKAPFNYIFLDFWAQTLWQHTKGYTDEFNVPDGMFLAFFA